MSIYEPAFEAVRGADQAPEERRYRPGTELVISMEAPADGYVTVFHGCEETGKVELVFPREADDNPHVLAGQEMPPIAGTVEGPPGEHWLKIIWTSEVVIDLAQHDLMNEYGRGLAVQEFCDRLDELRDEDFRITLFEYEVLSE